MTRPPPPELSASSMASVAPPPNYATTDSLDSDFVIILAALLCTLICVVGLIAVLRCTCLRQDSSGSPSSAASAYSHNANKGVKKKVLQSLPKFTYTSSAAASSSSIPGSASKFLAECSICLTEFSEGDELRVLPQCGHGFHVPCVDTWLASHSSCPSCRRVLVVERCQKCGGFPVAQGGGLFSAPTAEPEPHQRAVAAEARNCSNDTFLP
ncbi:hypothetical protein SAY86_031378 [Trapa natans]|uniref:RING-type domain-containing protein n=1 Tax=Trapa natans TaxID=22666 RepID=A0AAN7LRN3_TRANT|nr:hypothetical protein SAY86_031378 [Trapa natans]